MDSNKTNDEQVVNTICNSHCGGTCEMKVHVRDGKIIRIEAGGDESSHQMCARGRAYRQRVYAPDRLLYPLRRTGERGSGEFARISWDEALDTVANAMIRVRDTYGNDSILHFCSMADHNVLHSVSAFHRLLCQFGGYTAPWGTISSEGQNFAAGVMFSARATVATHQPEDYHDARLIIMWSWNPVTTQQGTGYPRALCIAKERGARIVCVDPIFTDSAATFADQWIPIRPCTDAAVFAAMAYIIISEDLHDKQFIEKYTFGFDKYRDYLFGVEDGVKKTPEWAEIISGVSAETIANLAREFAFTKPAVLTANLAAGRTAFGEEFHRSGYTLEAITGNAIIRTGRTPVSRAASHIVDLPSPPNLVEQGVPQRWNALPYRGNSVNSSARVNVSSFSDAILKGKEGGYPADYKFLWLSNTNYMNQLGELNKAIRAFKKLDFVLVTEQFMSTSARFADVILPVCTFLERNDLYAPRGGGVYGLLNKAIEPLGESKSQLQICEALALKLGIRDYNDKSDEEWVKFIVKQLSEEAGIPDYDTMKKQGIYRVKDQKLVATSNKDKKANEQKLLPTPSGKIEIYSQIVADMNHPLIPPVPKYIETFESLNDPLVEKYPLQLITPHLKRRAHSQFDNLPWLRALQTQAVLINTIDAGPRSIKNGDMVKIFNDRGEMIIPAQVTERIMPGVVAIPQGAWYAPDEEGVDHGGCANILTKNVTSPGGAFVCNTALIQIERLRK